MTRYYFDLGSDLLDADNRGIEIPDHATAAREAIAGLVAFAADTVEIDGPHRFAILVRTDGVANVFEAEPVLRCRLMA